MRGRIRGLVFDKDGTLFDFQQSWSSWMRLVLTRLAAGDREMAARAGTALGFDLAKGEFRPGGSFVAGTPESTLDILRLSFPKLGLADILGTLQSATDETPQVEAVPLKPLIGGLAAEYTLGLATNDHLSTARQHVAGAGIVDHFTFLAGSDSGFLAKPEPGMLLAFCDCTGIAPEQSVMIGDSPEDLKAGRAAGMITVGVLTGTASRQALAPLADTVLEDVGALPGWLQDARRSAAS